MSSTTKSQTSTHGQNALDRAKTKVNNLTLMRNDEALAYTMLNDMVDNEGGIEQIRGNDLKKKDILVRINKNLGISLDYDWLLIAICRIIKLSDTRTQWEILGLVEPNPTTTHQLSDKSAKRRAELGGWKAWTEERARERNETEKLTEEERYLVKPSPLLFLLMGGVVICVGVIVLTFC
jgi:hypothetical protein